MQNDPHPVHRHLARHIRHSNPGVDAADPVGAPMNALLAPVAITAYAGIVWLLCCFLSSSSDEGAL